VLDEAETVLLYVPRGHWEQLLDTDAPVTVLKVPAGQAMQPASAVTPVWSLYVPAGQETQPYEVRMNFQYLPGAHGVHAADPGLEIVPVGHGNGAVSPVVLQ
jgi:hypothetical protein